MVTRERESLGLVTWPDTLGRWWVGTANLAEEALKRQDGGMPP
jgi:hypothetical protein